MVKFNKRELYNVVFAARCAKKVEEETGYEGHYSEYINNFSQEEELEDKIQDLSESDKFEKNISYCEEKFRDKIDMIIDLNEDDYSSQKKYLQHRQALIDDLTEDIYDEFDDEFKED